MFGKYIDIIHANIIENLNEGQEEKANKIIVALFEMISKNEDLTNIYEGYGTIQKLGELNEDVYNDYVSEIIHENKNKKFNFNILKNFIIENELNEDIEPSKTFELLDKAIFENHSRDEVINIKKSIIESAINRKENTQIILDESSNKAFTTLLEYKITTLSESYSVDKETIKALLENDKEKIKESYDNLIDEVTEQIKEEAFNETSDLETFQLMKETKIALNTMKEVDSPNINDFERLFMLKGESNEKNS